MLKLANSDSIVIIERISEKPLDFNLKILGQKEAHSKIEDAFGRSSVLVSVDCDEDAFLIDDDQWTKIDNLTLVWQNRKVMPNDDTLKQMISSAPGLFPILAIDLQNLPLMVAWGKPKSIQEAINSGYGTYFSRSRNQKWVKGEESGHLQSLRSIYISLDPFYVVYEAEQKGAACHTGYYSCFFRQISRNQEPIFKYKNKVGETK